MSTRCSWFAREVLPLLRQRVPDARFCDRRRQPERRRCSALAGARRAPSPAACPTCGPISPHADVVVAPLRIARGIQNKVLEAMAMARPVVASPEAFEGVRAEPGRDILLASGVGETVQMIADVLDGRHAMMGAAARRAVEAAHQWSVTLRPLDALFGLTRPEPARADLPA